MILLHTSYGLISFHYNLNADYFKLNYQFKNLSVMKQNENGATHFLGKTIHVINKIIKTLYPPCTDTL